MKNATLGALLGCVMIYGSTAGAVGHSGTLCQPAGSSAVFYVPSGLQNPSTSNTSYICPVPVGFSIGSIDWSFRVYDGNSTGEVSCRGYTYDSTGNLIHTSSLAGSGAAFIGAATLAPPSGPASVSTYHYVGQCFLPPFQVGQLNSEIKRLDAF